MLENGKVALGYLAATDLLPGRLNVALYRKIWQSHREGYRRRRQKRRGRWPKKDNLIWEM
jgi:hypothetical protein